MPPLTVQNSVNLRPPIALSVETLLIDFHTHSTASDGALTPAELLRRAHARGVSALAVTDHDTVSGCLEAMAEPMADLQLVSGLELSCRWGGTTIHIVGLGIDPAQQGLTALLASLDRLREDRAGKIAEKLDRLGMSGALAGARGLAGSGSICRPHFANWLVSEGHAETAGVAFDKWLGNGKPADSKTQWPDLVTSVTAITAAGGLPVLAHPLKYRFTRTKLRALCSDFGAAGGIAVEIVNGRQTSTEIAALSRLAQEMDLAVSIGSDFHRDWPYGADLGVDTSVTRGLPAVWEMLL